MYIILTAKNLAKVNSLFTEFCSKMEREKFTEAVNKLEDEAGKTDDSGKAMETALSMFFY